MPAERAEEVYRFADLTLDVATHRVMRGGKEIALPGLSFDLLLALVRHAPRLLSADELMTLVWRGRVVNAETVAKRVELLRQALGDEVDAPRYIAVVRGRGYRLLPEVRAAEVFQRQASTRASIVAAPEPVAAVQPSRAIAGIATASLAIVVVAVVLWRLYDDAADDVPAAAQTAPSTETASIAVLPFLNLSDDPANVWFSDGMSEELLGALTKMPNLRVASRTSAFAFRDSQLPLNEIASTLNVNHVLEGSVRKIGDRIRVTAQLIDVRTDSHLWAENYDRRLEDVLAIQQEIADHIAGALKIRLIDRGEAFTPPTTNVEAYQLYLQGVQVWNLRGEQNVRQAIRLLTHATELDPEFARAYAALAIAYTSVPFWYAEPEIDWKIKGENAAKRAQALDPSLPHPYCVFAALAAQDRDWIASEAYYRRALELSPNDTIATFWMSEMYSVAGRRDPALKLILTSLERDPISMAILHDVANLYERQHQFELGCPYVERGMRIGTNTHTYLQAARCHEHRGDLDAMREALIAAERAFHFDRPVFQLAHRARTDVTERNAALQAIAHEAAQGRGVPTETYIELGEYDAAFEIMERTWRRGNYGPLRDLWDIESSELRAHPRFRKLVEEIGLVEFWRKSGWPELCRPLEDSFTCD